VQEFLYAEFFCNMWLAAVKCLKPCIWHIFCWAQFLEGFPKPRKGGVRNLEFDDFCRVNQTAPPESIDGNN